MSPLAKCLLGVVLSSTGFACGDKTGPADVAVPAKLVLSTAPPASSQNHVVFSPQPVVQLQDANGAQVAQAGTVITVAITAGGGTLEGPTTATTGSSGAASFNNLSIGGAAGEKTLAFSAPNLTSATATIMLTAGSVTSMAAMAGAGQSSEVGTAVATPPAVRVTDVDGNGVNGIEVTFTVDSGGGLITGATQLTDASGVATVGSWLLGPIPGSNTLIATAEGLPGVSVTFRASGVSTNSCRRATSSGIALGANVSGALDAGDCTFHDGQFHDFYNFTLDAQQAVIVSVRSEDFDPAVDLFTWDDQRDRGVLYDTVNTSRNVRLKAILAPGRYETAASSVDPGDTGPYRLRVADTPPTVESCEIVFVVRGISTAQQLAATDCVDGSEMFYGDILDLWLEAGERVTLTHSSTEFTPLVLLYQGGSGDLVGQADGFTTGTAEFEFQAEVTGPYYIVATSALILESGAYTLTVSDPSLAETTSTTRSMKDRDSRLSRAMMHGESMPNRLKIPWKR